MAQITSVTSESLQAKIRTLLPSQQGFGEDLQASNVILPVIDLTSTAEGTNVPEYQAQAIAFGSQTAFSATNGTTALANSAGFYRIFGVSNAWASGAGTVSTNSFTMSDGLSNKTVWAHNNHTNSTDGVGTSVNFDFVVFLSSGESISVVSNSTAATIQGSYRQVANVNGDPVNPNGFSPQ